MFLNMCIHVYVFNYMDQDETKINKEKCFDDGCVGVWMDGWI